MKVERISEVGIIVDDIDKSMKFYDDVFGIRFKKLPLDQVQRTKTVMPGPWEQFEEQPHVTAFSSTALIMVTSAPPVSPSWPKPGLAEFSLKVDNIEQAKAEMKAKGIRQVSEIVIGSCREAVYCSDDLGGAYMSLLEFSQPSEWEALFTLHGSKPSSVGPIKPDETRAFKVEKVSAISIVVDDLDRAMRFYKDIFGLEFKKIPYKEVGRVERVMPGPWQESPTQPHQSAAGPIGFLVQAVPPVSPTWPKPGLFAFALKVDNMEKAKAQLKAKGIRITSELQLGSLREVSLYAEDEGGLAIGLVEHSYSSDMEAVLTPYSSSPEVRTEFLKS